MPCPSIRWTARSSPGDHGELNTAAGMPRNGRVFPSYDILVTITLREGARMTRHNRLGVLTAASLFALSLGVGAVFAAGEPDPKPTSPPAQKSGGEPKAKAGSKKKKEQKSEQEFRDQYRARLRAGAGRRIRRGVRGLQGARRRTIIPTSRTISATRRASSATTTSRRSGTSARSPPIRSTCAPASTTACGTSSRATC